MPGTGDVPDVFGDMQDTLRGLQAVADCNWDDTSFEDETPVARRVPPRAGLAPQFFKDQKISELGDTVKGVSERKKATPQTRRVSFDAPV